MIFPKFFWATLLHVYSISASMEYPFKDYQSFCCRLVALFLSNSGIFPRMFSVVMVTFHQRRWLVDWPGWPVLGPFALNSDLLTNVPTRMKDSKRIGFCIPQCVQSFPLSPCLRSVATSSTWRTSSPELTCLVSRTSKSSSTRRGLTFPNLLSLFVAQQVSSLLSSGVPK